MPKLGQSEEEATIVRWNKNEGEAVAKGDVLFEIETDKALLEVESFFEGTLLKIAVPAGTTVPVQSVVGFIGEPGEPLPQIPPVTAPHEPPAELRPAQAEGPPGAPPATVPAGPPASAPSEAPASLRISPRAARLAKESLVDPKLIRGTGPDGRITERDVRAYLAEKGYERISISPAARELAARENIDILSIRTKDSSGRIEVADIERAVWERPRPMSRMRQVIAARMLQSVTTAPHFFVTVSADVTELEAFRQELKAQGRAYTATDFLLKAAALALREFPEVNSSTDGKQVWRRSSINVGMAVSLDQGLVVPVIFGADELTLEEIHKRATELTGKARAGKLTPEEMSGGTFTISNMGMLDIENFAAIINPGESAILAVSSARKQPVAKEDRMAIRLMMKMTLSSDHRIIDGALAARFINSIRQKLEETEFWKRLVQ
jgi:pyruvate dehydrogenase E2 component (dihydrolipoamide acetyltransferase)